MTDFIRTDPAQPNLLDGTIYAYELREGGCYITVAGNDETPLILSTDLEDIASLRAIAAHYPPNTMPGFSFYAEPDEVAGQKAQSVVGLGSVGDTEYAYVGAGVKGVCYGEVLMTREQLGTLIGKLRDIHESMGPAS